MKTVLLVDDEPDILAVYSMLLDMAGFAVLTAADGRQALAVLESKVPDVIVTDWMMPVMNGEAFCEALRADGSSLCDVPVIVASAAMKAPEGEQRLYNQFVRKPLEIGDLVAAINEVLAGKA
jgi:CheY-like chemotaxis protein